MKLAKLIAAVLLAPVFALVIGFSVGFGAALEWLYGGEE